MALPLRRTRQPRPARQAALDALGAVGPTGFADGYPWQLSGGMQQRVAIARALACDPVLLMTDEPFGSVDAQTHGDLEDLVLRVRAERDITILVVTHDIDESVYVGERVIGLPAPRDQITTKELREFAHRGQPPCPRPCAGNGNTVEGGGKPTASFGMKVFPARNAAG